MDQKSDKTNDKQKDENIRTEYNAICEKLKTLPNFRFMLIGFYVAAVAVIASSEPGKISFIGMIVLTVCLWIIDLRTRRLIEIIRERGAQIEEDYWDYKGKEGEDAYITRLKKEKSSKVKVFHLVPLRVRHSWGLDLLFSVVIGYSVYKIWTLTGVC